MWLSSLTLTNFRSYSQITALFDQGFNLIWGPNGLGKTNLVEAIYFSSVFESHRTPSSNHLIKEGNSAATIHSILNSNKRTAELSITIGQNGTKSQVNGILRKRLSESLGVCSAVLFAPEDMDVIRRDPSDRRHFIDQVVTQFQPRMLAVRSDYEKALKQRNALLKSLRQANVRANSITEAVETSLQIWDEQIADFGTQLTIARAEAVNLLNPLLSSFYQEISADSDTASMELELDPKDESNDDKLGFAEPAMGNEEAFRTSFLRGLVSLRSKELDRGVTLIGPHRQDIKFQLSGSGARYVASQGEAWSLALGAKLALATLISDRLPGGTPILLLDDVFSVLDPVRRGRLLRQVRSFEQVLITATSRDGLPEVDWSRTTELSAAPSKPGQEKSVKIENTKSRLDINEDKSATGAPDE